MMALSNWNTPRHLDNELISSSSEKKQVRAFHLLEACAAPAAKVKNHSFTFKEKILI
jgi:hypothetical protein